MDKIIIKGARENNLKNVSLEIPKNSFVVMTGVSGSGKSSLAFDTIYAEGQRRYVESLSSYARQFIGVYKKPDVDSIEGLSPSISIDQKSTNKNPRSTVGTITEIYDYLRLLYARVGVPYCPEHKIPIKAQSIEEMTDKVLGLEGEQITIYAPVVRGEKGIHKDIVSSLRSLGFIKIRVNGEILNIDDEINLEKNIKDDIDVLIDKLTVNNEERGRVFETIELAAKIADGKVLIESNKENLIMSEKYACPKCNYSILELEPRIFSFNSPFGACEVCKGLGSMQKINIDLLIKDENLSINEGGLNTISTEESNIFFTMIKTVSKKKGIDLDKPIKKLSKEEKDILFYGSDEVFEFFYKSKNGGERKTIGKYEGIINNLERRYLETASTWIREWIEGFMYESICPSCGGRRLKNSSLNVFINKKNIYDLTAMSIRDLIIFIDSLKLKKEELEISKLIIKEIKDRLSFLNNVGLSYLTLARSAASLSGGEAQRIRLATQIGSKLSGVLYVLDEPSIGLHQKDNEKLINSLKEMRDLGNTLIVVEHDEETMTSSDYLIDIGPGAGEYGGEIVEAGTPEEVKNNKNSLTGRYLKKIEKILVPKTRRKGNSKYIEIIGAKENNLKGINIKIPLGKFIAVTGVSGSGKSSLINEVLYKNLRNTLYKAREIPGKVKEIKNINYIDKVVMISQDAIGRTPRSNPGTYVGVFDEIRKLFAEMPEAKARGYTSGRFSFNVKGGRCEACRGDGVKKIEMHFLADVYVPCDVCGGKRYNDETLKVKYKAKNIHDVLELRISEALRFFENIPKIKKGLQVLSDVGLSYMKLGQSAPTLSGGEAGRVKLAKELQKKPTGKSLFILDEPTTGLHTDDIKRLLKILDEIVDNGDTVIVIEHNLDVIKVADHIVDLGPDGGDFGGEVIAEGSPEEVSKNKTSYTAEYLRKIL